MNNLKPYIDKYIQLLNEKGENGESYKWEAINHFQENWDIDADDFEAMFLESFKKVSNLLYQNSWGFIKTALNHYDEEVREMFKSLYDEAKPLVDRLNDFETKTQELLENIKKVENNDKLNSQQDERTISVYLSFMYPEKYFLYKDSFYKIFCRELKINIKKTGEKYLHYLKIAEDIKNNYIVDNTEVLELHKEIYPHTEWNNINLIVQNFFYLIFKKMDSKSKEIVPAYYCAGFHFYSKNPTNQLPRFIKNGIWENGYDDKFIKVVKEVPIGSLIAAKTSYTMNEDDKTISVLEVHCIGKVLQNINDGRTLKVDWQKNFKSFILKRKGGYRSTISKVHNQTNIDAIFYNNDYDERIIEDEIEDIDDSERPQFPLNQILYGPPGTGKTYRTKKIAVEIIENKVYSESTDDRKAIIKAYEGLIESGQISFTTFHQSMSYEDFVEGIKPVMNGDEESELRYEVQDGIFKSICNRANKTRKIQVFEKGAIVEIEPFEVAWSHLVELVEQKIESSEMLKLPTLTNKEIKLIGVSEKGNLLAKPAGGSKLDYIISYSRIKKLFNVFPKLEEIKNIDKEFRQVIGGSNSTAYWSVLNYLINWIEDNEEEVISDKKSVISKEGTQSHNYVLIIDEINRGNVSGIFGELITLIEKDKRAGQDEAISCLLPYSKEKFFVPDNIYIVATMNTADRSVEVLDTALRRRFSFKELLPDPTLLDEHQYKDVNLEKLLSTINQRIELLVDKDHQIGHSYFYGIDSLEDLRNVFKDKIVPLLEEYFYGDFGKIGLVLGENFIELKKIENKSVLAKFKAYEDVDFVTDKKIFRLTKEINDMNVEDFKSVYENKVQ